MERIVIACYKPHEGKEKALHGLVETHVGKLQREGLASGRKPIIMKAANGTVVEIFGWKSAEAIEAAHSHPAVLQMWKEFEEVCEYVHPLSIAELGNLFPEFEPL